MVKSDHEMQLAAPVRADIGKKWTELLLHSEKRTEMDVVLERHAMLLSLRNDISGTLRRHGENMEPRRSRTTNDIRHFL